MNYKITKKLTSIELNLSENALSSFYDSDYEMYKIDKEQNTKTKICINNDQENCSLIQNNNKLVFPRYFGESYQIVVKISNNVVSIINIIWGIYKEF